jgi:5-formyltetrahydrofolate cyclo-ligase
LLGRGKGYYDAYLNKCAGTPKPPFTVGLAFNEQIVDIIPTDSHDQSIAKIFYPFSKD